MYTVHRRAGKTYYRNVSKQIRYWCHQDGISLRELSRRIDVPSYLAATWNSGGGVKQEYISKMLELFDVTLDEFIVTKRFIEKETDNAEVRI
jgi:transcriptional regulator with XRE-family HTH domain